MSTLYNEENNVVFKLNLLDERLYIDYLRENNMNWISCEIVLEVNNEKIEYCDESLCDMNIDELKYFLKNLNEIVDFKKQNQFLKQDFTYITRENLFEITFSEPKEKDLIEVELWFNVGQLTNGKIYGYSKGARFTITVQALEKFMQELAQELYKILKRYK